MLENTLSIETFEMGKSRKARILYRRLFTGQIATRSWRRAVAKAMRQLGRLRYDESSETKSGDDDNFPFPCIHAKILFSRTESFLR